ncbi:hypothetical protein [Paenibacillus sp. AD87]|uniref:hypothetical protein n=1 Tax=Paenibacillus sp. AD87 TaxID=1528787 RepID=UPI001E2C30C1|nr:hypothetical protein [Paenibacillus sp. AD87]
MERFKEDTDEREYDEERETKKAEASFTEDVLSTLIPIVCFYSNGVYVSIPE